MNNFPKISKGFIFTFSAAAFWAVSILITKFILRGGESSYNIVFWSTVLALPFWLAIFYQKREEFKRATAKDYFLLISIGIMGTLAASLIEVLALKYTQAINYSFLIRSSLLFTIVFAFMFLGEKITKKKIIISLAILIGVYFISTNGRLIKFSAGDLLTLSEAALISFGNTILGKIVTKRMSSNLSASASFLAGLIPVIILGFVFHSVSFPKSFIPLIFLVVLSTAGVMSRFNAYKNATASYIAMIYSFTPVIVTFAALPLFGESLGILQIAGGVLIILAGIFTEKLKI